MTDSQEEDMATLRRQAEEKLQNQSIDVPEEISLDQARHLIHELQVHQIELEMQNEMLRQTQYDLEITRSKYIDLYEFAPVGYVTIDQNKRISQANLTIATKLGIDRATLLNQHFAEFIATGWGDTYHRWHQTLFAGQQPQPCEVEMNRKDGTRFFAQLEGRIMQTGPSQQNQAQVIVNDITPLKQTETALRESEQRFRILFEQAPLGMAIIDQDQRITRANALLGRMLEYTEQELTQLTLADFRDSEDQSSKSEQIDRLFQRKIGSCQFEQRYQTKNNKIIWVLITANLIENGAPAFGLAMIKDITARKRVERGFHLLLALTKAISEAPNFDAALQIAVDRICDETAWILGEVWLPSANGAHLQASGIHYCRNAEDEQLQAFRAADKETMFAPNEGLAGEVWASAQPKWYWNVAELSETKYPRVTRAALFGLQTALGVPISVDNKVLAVLVLYRDEPPADGEGIVELISAVAAQLGEVLQRKRVEAALRENEQFLRSIYTGTELGIAVIDVTDSGEFVIVGTNPALERLTGRSAQSIQGRRIAEFDPSVDPEVLAAVEDYYQRCVESGEPLEYEIKTSFQAQQAWLLVRLEPLKDEDERVHRLINTVIPITERKQAENERNRLLEALDRQRDQLRALASRLATVQEAERHQLARELHDKVGQNLTALAFTLNFVQSQFAPESQSQGEKVYRQLDESLNLVEQTTDRIRDVITELRPPMLDEYGLVEALDWYASQFASREGITVTVQGKTIVPRLTNATESTLFRIVQEALSNAAQHGQASRISISIVADTRVVRLIIADNGVGFDPTQITSSQKRQAIGLLGMKERAGALAGSCRIESELGQGTRVVVEVPR